MADQAGTIWFPNKRVIRTILQTVASIIVVAASVLGVFQIVAPQVLEAIRDLLPPTWYVWLVGAIAAVGAVAGALAKIMTIPHVDAFLKKFGAGSTPAAADLPDAVEHEKDLAVIHALLEPVDNQVMTLHQAAARLGIPPTAVTRDDYRGAVDPE